MLLADIEDRENQKHQYMRDYQTEMDEAHGGSHVLRPTQIDQGQKPLENVVDKVTEKHRAEAATVGRRQGWRVDNAGDLKLDGNMDRTMKVKAGSRRTTTTIQKLKMVYENLKRGTQGQYAGATSEKGVRNTGGARAGSSTRGQRSGGGN
ncbi:hypothetical protein C8J57DRAFT_1236669 [Mycena rebaudengoi]|nr:hypothetical protein C8J57DRAFT_1255391 [Mycena rebaudengoi]KAJ7236521.1 hypothetical protein C8J57DRAFT_1479195 [Mycena rebaudengoi]KAJ7254425.1 hypothetical protein C8J57DRAFT_1236669 [Mycena rebaudengoi]